MRTYVVPIATCANMTTPRLEDAKRAKRIANTASRTLMLKGTDISTRSKLQCLFVQRRMLRSLP